MKERKGIIVLSIVAALLVGGALLSGMRTGVETAVAAPSATLNRPHDPVVVEGSVLPALDGAAIDALFVYAYQGETAVQIPFQIDEKNENGRYVHQEDGLFDSNDELIFMAADAGDYVITPTLPISGTPPIQAAYTISITDPLGGEAWAYVFHSDVLSQTFTADYASYDAGQERIIGNGRYSFSFHPDHPIRNYLTVGSSANLLDRDKLRLSGTYTFIPFDLDEEDSQRESDFHIDGAVRVTWVMTSSIDVGAGPIRTRGTTFAYQSLVVQTGSFDIPGGQIDVDHIRISTDLSSAATGMTYYDANNAAGVTINGSPDSIVKTPPTSWMQVSGNDGSFIYVNAIPSGMGGTQRTYYEDDSTLNDGTGDGQSYADAGFQVDNPNEGTYALSGYLYFLSGNTANMGADYLAWYEHPLQITAVIPTISPAPSSNKLIYLPVIQK